ncbi:solute carrier family 9 [Vigna unguiculata]|uniref:Solute carrier family 9 n=1 Tax=Vigna unguiculata TaxID=3917 RepID=A0A4D6KJW0_VIGUN|nr:solute carrier family 9 [Vigna unguiculata]
MVPLSLISECALNLASEHAQVVPISLFVAVLCLCLVVGHLLEENRWINESIVAIIIGIIAGIILLLITKGKSSHILTFNEELFFIYLLPPIIFNAGFQVKKKQFFHNFLTIMMFGVIGVFISTFVITIGSWWIFPKLNLLGLSGQDYLAIGTIFSATDTVCTLQVLHQDETPLLYSLVFGEGVVNDATSVVLFNAVQKLDVSKFSSKTFRFIGDFLYLFGLSTGLGVLLCDLSGIITVFFCGILMSHYAWYNVTETSRITTRHVFATMSFIAETFIFLYVGMDALDIEKWKMTKFSYGSLLGIYSSLILLILLGRAAFVFPLSAIANYTNTRASSDQASHITFRQQIIVWWAGLMRGAVSIALAFKQFTYSGVTSDPLKATMITNTIIVVLFSTLVFGFLTKPLMRYLLPHAPTRKNIINEESGPPSEDLNLPLLSLEESAATNISRAKESLSMLIESPVFTIHHYWRRFDDAYMRPFFGGPHHNESQC